MKSLILNFLLGFMILMALKDFGTEHFNLLPNSMVAHAEKLIQGGRDANPNEIPFQVSLQIRLMQTSRKTLGPEVRGEHFCGGTLLNGYTVLTAAHCFIGVHKRYIQVVAGTNVLTGPPEEQQKRLVDRVIIHDYTKIAEDWGFNDIAIVIVSQPFDFDDDVYAELPAADEYPKGNAQVSGWGRITPEQRNVEGILQVADVPIMSQEECQRRLVGHRKLIKNHWVNTTICTLPHTGDATPLKGDSGGPLFQDGVVVGVVSGGTNPWAYYTRVSAFLEWIDSNTFEWSDTVLIL